MSMQIRVPDVNRLVNVDSLLDCQCCVHVLCGMIQVARISVPDVARQIDLGLEQFMPGGAVAKLPKGRHDFALCSQRRVNSVDAALGNKSLIH